jgi:hypothetical protein
LGSSEKKGNSQAKKEKLQEKKQVLNTSVVLYLNKLVVIDRISSHEFIDRLE